MTFRISQQRSWQDGVAVAGRPTSDNIELQQMLMSQLWL
jgi:hypothetical protein